MTTEEILGEVWGFLMTVGPIILIVGGIFFLAAFSLVVFIFVKVFKGMFGKDSKLKGRL